jgi:hypothetical protein
LGDQNKKNERGVVRDIKGSTEICKGIWWGILKERYYFEDLGLEENIILKWILQEYYTITWIWFI